MTVPATLISTLISGESKFTFTLSGQDVNVRSAAIAAGWNGVSAVEAVIDSSTIISASSTGVYALTINGSFPSGITLINNGIIVGRGGNGAAGGVYAASYNGYAGGPALLASVACKINNLGAIYGGGGGGGGGGAGRSVVNEIYILDYGGGGGGGGIGGASGGIAGTPAPPGVAGGSSTTTAIGYGGVTTGPWNTGDGGNGGNYGSPGANGTAAAIFNDYNGPGGTGGAAGNCLSGNSNITWIATGTRLGAIV